MFKCCARVKYAPVCSVILHVLVNFALSSKVVTGQLTITKLFWSLQYGMQYGSLL